MRTVEKQSSTFIDVKTNKVVRCAFDNNRNCSPNCAACDIFGSYDDKVDCRRNGDDNSFRIANIKVNI